MNIARALALTALCAAMASTSATAQQTLSWSDSISSLGLDASPGRSYAFVCPAGGQSAVVWGTDVYTHDSSICVAAMHAGFITLTDGGVVSLTMEAGRASYEGSVRNGVATRDYGSWGQSYVFGEPLEGEIVISWSDTAIGLGFGEVGAIHTVLCPGDGAPNATIWGTDVYTNDSAICVAATHEGRINAASGGSVTIRIEGGRDSYAGSARNGVTSSNYGAWGGSYVFIKR